MGLKDRERVSLDTVYKGTLNLLATIHYTDLKSKNKKVIKFNKLKNIIFLNIFDKTIIVK
jgi:hypothetical protein